MYIIQLWYFCIAIIGVSFDCTCIPIFVDSKGNDEHISAVIGIFFIVMVKGYCAQMALQHIANLKTKAVIISA